MPDQETRPKAPTKPSDSTTGAPQGPKAIGGLNRRWHSGPAAACWTPGQRSVWPFAGPRRVFVSAQGVPAELPDGIGSPDLAVLYHPG